MWRWRPLKSADFFFTTAISIPIMFTYVHTLEQPCLKNCKQFSCMSRRVPKNYVVIISVLSWLRLDVMFWSFKNTFGPMTFFLFFNTQKMLIESIIRNSIAMTSLKLMHWRDSNPGLLLLRRMRCRLRHAAGPNECTCSDHRYDGSYVPS
jgi:hypothetical protein